MFTHLNPHNEPQMVNVGEKTATHRMARARACVDLPAVVAEALRGHPQAAGPKGPVFQTAILAGVMAAKKTGELIPLCHPLPLEDCAIHIEFVTPTRVAVECRVETFHKTGVEMEALTGAAVAALTIYDMCKGLSREMVIHEVRLLEKTGGRHDYHADA